MSEVGKQRPVQCQTRAKSLVKMARKIKKNICHSPTHPQEILGILSNTALCSMLSPARVPAQQLHYTPILVSVTTIKKNHPQLESKAILAWVLLYPILQIERLSLEDVYLPLILHKVNGKHGAKKIDGLSSPFTCFVFPKPRPWEDCSCQDWAELR